MSGPLLTRSPRDGPAGAHFTLSDRSALRKLFAPARIDEDFRRSRSSPREQRRAHRRNVELLLPPRQSRGISYDNSRPTSQTNFRLWQDQDAIAPGKDWEAEITKAVEQSAFFIPIVTPRAVSSDYCQFEFNSFLARERALGRGDLVFPILWISVPALSDETQWRGDPALSIVAKRQYVVWRSFRYFTVDTPAFGQAIDNFCSNVVKTLREPWLSPEERVRQETEAKRRVEEEERVRQEAEAKRQAEEQERLRKQALAKKRAKEEARKREEAEAKRRAGEEERVRRVAEAKRQAEEQERLRKQALAKKRTPSRWRRSALSSRGTRSRRAPIVPR